VIGFEASEIINDTPENVFAFVEDTDLAPLWLIKVTNTEKLTDGPVRAGTRFRETRMVGKREVSGLVEISRHDGPPDATEPPYYHSGTSTAMGVKASYHYTFAAAGKGKTRVSLRCEAIPMNLLGRFMVRGMVGVMKREDSDQLTFLKQAIEYDDSEDDE